MSFVNDGDAAVSQHRNGQRGLNRFSRVIDSGLYRAVNLNEVWMLVNAVVLDEQTGRTFTATEVASLRRTHQGFRREVRAGGFSHADYAMQNDPTTEEAAGAKRCLKNFEGAGLSDYIIPLRRALCYQAWH